MPIWLSILIDLAIKFGLPWLLKHFPWLPLSIKPVIAQMVADLENHNGERKEIIADAKGKMAACYGTNCKR